MVVFQRKPRLHTDSILMSYSAVLLKKPVEFFMNKVMVISFRFATVLFFSESSHYTHFVKPIFFLYMFFS